MKANKLSIKEILENIQQGKQFEAIPLEGGFRIKVNRYVPFYCTSIHNGSNLRPELQSKIALSEYERWYEEDPNTADFIASLPISIVGLDSRYEYDLNRVPNDCIYQSAWGKNVWNKRLTTQEIKISRQKHANYYRVIHALTSKIEQLFGGCIVYDIHSYNYKRLTKEAPLFNVGTEKVDKTKFAPFISNWLDELSKIQLPETTNQTTENQVFFGRGYNLEYITSHFKNTLVLATEIKKIYCNELSGNTYPKVVKGLQQKLKLAILNNANFFSSTLKNWHYLSTPKLLGQQPDAAILKIDKSLFKLLKNFELLAIVNPVNTKIEKRKFFKSKYSELPNFKYNPVKINPFVLKQSLLSAPIQSIQDISIRNLYEAVVSGYSDKIDMIGSLNTEKFLYNSLRYFGRPSKKDLINANYLVHLPDIIGEAKKEPTYSTKEAIEIFKVALEEYHIQAKIELNNNVISKIMVLNSKKSILFQPDSIFKRKELMALIEHEIGVHMVTTMNSAHQKLQVFNLGLPVNTQTQEGLAILSEYLSGNITLRRLKKIALRVIVVDMMCSGADFIDCFDSLIKNFDVEENEAFNIVARIFRGGGFTKDYLYLSGFVKIYKLWEDEFDLTPLLVGKTSLPFFNTIEEMMGREMISKPKYITKSYLEPKIKDNNPIYEYIFSGLKY